MTDRERLLRVFRQQVVDRIPVAPFIHVNYVKEFTGSQEIDAAVETPGVYRHFGLDLIHRNCTPSYDAFGPPGAGWETQVTYERFGRDETAATVIHTPGGDLHVRNELRWTYEYDAEDAVCEFPIKSEADFELMATYQPPHGTADVSALARARAACGEDGVTAPWIQGAFNLVAFYYRRLDDLVLDARLNPDFYHRLMNHFIARYQPFVQQLIDAGADILSYGGNIANPPCGPPCPGWSTSGSSTTAPSTPSPRSGRRWATPRWRLAVGPADSTPSRRSSTRRAPRAVPRARN